MNRSLRLYVLSTQDCDLMFLTTYDSNTLALTAAFILVNIPRGVAPPENLTPAFVP